MSLRDDWQFRFPLADVIDAAEAKADYHQGRIEWWEKEQQVVTNEIEDSGLVINKIEVTGGNRQEVSIDTSLARRLSECGSKIESHQRELVEYERWVEALKAAGDEELDLDVDDIRYFGLSAKTEDGE